MKNKDNQMPEYVINWADKYFHQSAFDFPLGFPNRKVIDFLARFKKNKNIKVYRGINKYNRKNYTGIESWTYDKNVSSRYAEEIGGQVIEKTFKPKDVLLDTTLLSDQEKISLGYDYKIDDKEVLIIR